MLPSSLMVVAESLSAIGLDLAARGAAVLLLAVAVTLMMHRLSAAARHLVWLLAMAALLALPVLSAVLPEWRVLPSWARLVETEPAPVIRMPDSAAMAHQPASAAAALDMMPAAPPAQTAHAPSPGVVAAPWWLMAWTIGAAALLLPLPVGWLSLWRLRRRAVPLDGQSWRQTMEQVKRELGIERPVALLCGGEREMPMAAGILRPAVILPADCHLWDAARRRLVLQHELAHVKRRDCLWQLIAHAARALHWYNPLAWHALRRLLAESERACDDLVLSAGADGPDYAEQLIHLASGARSRHMRSAAAIAMARPSQLEGRVLAILDGRRSRMAMSRTIVLSGVLALSGLVLPLAMLQAQPDVTAEMPAAMAEAPEAQREVDAETARRVDEAVKTISALAESDPRVAQAMQTLHGLDDVAVSMALAQYLRSDVDAQRRAAIYILWLGPMEQVHPASKPLFHAMHHEEDLTRGMAALAVGQRKIESRVILEEMLANDPSGYARRCAAYALGLLGDPQARPALEQAMQDPEAMVRLNAQAAMTMLEQNAPAAEPQPHRPEQQRGDMPRVQQTTPAADQMDVDPSLREIRVMFDRPMDTRGGWSFVGGGDNFPRVTGQPRWLDNRTIVLPVELQPGKGYWMSINAEQFSNFRAAEGQPAQPYPINFATRPADGGPQLSRPQVTQVSPAGGAVDVDPATAEIRVTFDQPMNTQAGWSFVGGGEHFPERAGEIRWIDERTIVMPVRLRPGQQYHLSINSGTFQNFQGRNGLAAVAYPVQFRTAAAR